MMNIQDTNLYEQTNIFIGLARGTLFDMKGGTNL
jgi:hypothetical protein